MNTSKNEKERNKGKKRKKENRESIKIIKVSLSAFFDFFISNYKNTQMGSFIALSTCFGFMTAQMVNDNLSLSPLVAVLLFHFIFMIGVMLIYLGERIVKFLFRYNLVFLFDWAMLSYLFSRGLYSGSLKSVRIESIVLCIVFAFVVLVFSNSMVGIFLQKRKTIMLLTVTSISSVCLIVGSIFIFGEGFKGSKVDEYRILVQSGIDECIRLEEATEIDGETFGPYQVVTMSYGEDETDSLESKEVNLSMYATRPDGLYGMYREKILKMDLEHALIKGLVWYPEEMENCPMLFIMHGNHSINETSHDGYAYLGEYLASYGYMVVSVDENALNTLSSENDARAILFLENMRMLEQYTKEKTSALYQKGDFSKVAIAGHSRGGEAAAITYLFNQLDYYTENGMRKLNFDFDIKSIIAIAPSIDQFKPADHSVVLEDVNYLLLQGANDQDICGYMGMTQYENIQFTGNEDCIKTSLYIINANHGQFNSKWGNYDMMFPNSLWLNVKNFMEEVEQQKIAKTMIKTFLDVTLLEEDIHKGLLYDYRKYEEILPETLYIQQYQDSSQITYCDFEEDVKLETGSLLGVSLYAYHVGVWGELQEQYSNTGMSKARQNHVLKLKWTEKENPFIQIKIPEANFENQILTFSICDADTRQVEENIYELLECEVVLKDTEFQSVTLNCSDYATLYPPIPTKLGKVQYLIGREEYKKVLQTIRIPISDFENENEFVNFQSIASIEIHIIHKESGEVFIDEIGICNE